MWSNGTPVTARDVEFWQNLVKANKTDFGGYVPGAYPDNITSTKVVNPTTVRFTLDKPYNHEWFLYNELSQITPLPLAWDKTSASGSTGTADQTPAGAKAVYQYLEGQNKNLTTYATNPTWKIVDGPWHLKSFNTTGNAVFVPNPKYSGANKPQISQFTEVPFTSATAEIDAIRGGQGPSIGYVPLTDVNQIGFLKSQGYQVAPWPDWNMNFMAINFNNPTVGPVFKQLYIRQALQHVMNQPLLVKDAYSGYAWADYGPVPPVPSNPYVSSFAKQNPYPFSTSQAAQSPRQPRLEHGRRRANLSESRIGTLGLWRRNQARHPAAPEPPVCLREPAAQGRDAAVSIRCRAGRESRSTSARRRS